MTVNRTFCKWAEDQYIFHRAFKNLKRKRKNPAGQWFNPMCAFSKILFIFHLQKFHPWNAIATDYSLFKFTLEIKLKGNYLKYVRLKMRCESPKLILASCVLRKIQVLNCLLILRTTYSAKSLYYFKCKPL